jgi:hypothetical protein
VTTPTNQPPPQHGQGQHPQLAGIERVLARFERARRRPDGSYMVQCPCHDDRRPSLHITVSEGGQILLHDFAGCRTEDILRAVGWTWLDLAPPGPAGGGTTSRRRPPPRPTVPGGLTAAAQAATDVAVGRTAVPPQGRLGVRKEKPNEPGRK